MPFNLNKYVSKEQHDIHNRVGTAVRNGTLIKPGACSDCLGITKAGDLHAHHTDYSKPLSVLWLCRVCHGKAHRKVKKARSAIYLEEMLAEAKKVLPHRVFAVIFQAARARSGGRTRAANRLSALEQIAMDETLVTKASIGDLNRTMDRLSDLPKENTEAIIALLTAEIERRSNDVATLDDALAVIAGGGEVPEMTTDMEVIEVFGDGSFLAAYDDNEPELFMNTDRVNIEPGDIVQIGNLGFVGPSTSLEPHLSCEAEEIFEKAALIRKHTKRIGFTGPKSAKLLFVGAAPDTLEAARCEALVGASGEIFKSRYLKPLGLTKADVGIGFVMPVLPRDNMVTADVLGPWKDIALKCIDEFKGAKVVAVGKAAREALKSFGRPPDFNLSHPAAIRRGTGDFTEITRKMKRIRKTLDGDANNMQNGKRELESPESKGGPAKLADDTNSELQKSVRIVRKADGKKQIVYGVVIDPYMVDAHEDWTPPAEVEQTAHNFLKRSRVVGLQHQGKANASVVESWVEKYPSGKDYRAALNNEPHKVSRRQFGTDKIHSGTWVLGIELGDREWQQYLNGEITGFSPGGYSFKTTVPISAMPKVEFVDIE